VTPSPSFRPVAVYPLATKNLHQKITASRSVAQVKLTRKCVIVHAVGPYDAPRSAERHGMKVLALGHRQIVCAGGADD
jgi:hypothetical protein